MTHPHHILLIFAATFYVNHLYIFGLHKFFHAEFLSDSNPEAGVEEKSKGLGWKVSYYSVIKLGWHKSKAICLCPPCMASVHSYLYWIVAVAVGFQTWMLLLFPVYVIALTGYNYKEMRKIN